MGGWGAGDRGLSDHARLGGWRVLGVCLNWGMGLGKVGVRDWEFASCRGGRGLACTRIAWGERPWGLAVVGSLGPGALGLRCKLVGLRGAGLR